MNEIKIELIDFEVMIPSVDESTIVDRITIKVPVTRDPETGELLLTPAAHEKIEQTQERHMGLISPAELRAIRSRLGLTQRELGNLIQVGEKSYTRWETGRARPSRSLNVLLCALRDGRLTIPYLRSLQRPFVEWWSSPLQKPVFVKAFLSGEHAGLAKAA
jgi:DNA-binding transcriptional regulator YiaG